MLMPSAAATAYFYPRPPRGGRLPYFVFFSSFAVFLSTPSARRATSCARRPYRRARYFYPRPPRGGRPCIAISKRLRNSNFYPRPPRGGRHIRYSTKDCANTFLSTPSARRATPVKRLGASASKNFYPRPPRGGRPRPHISHFGVLIYFYPRPPRGGRRTICGAFSTKEPFLSTPSARRATAVQRKHVHKELYFYPRPPRGGRRNTAAVSVTPYNDFYPRPPRGGRRKRSNARRYPTVFLSTPSARRATDYRLVKLAKFDISIHALREEGDPAQPRITQRPKQFLSTPSARRATGSGLRLLHEPQNFYPRPPRGGRLLRWLSPHL